MNKNHVITLIIAFLALGPFLVACSSAPEKQNIEIPAPPTAIITTKNLIKETKKTQTPIIKSTATKKKTLKKTLDKKTTVKKPKKSTNPKLKVKTKTITKKTTTKAKTKQSQKQIHIKKVPTTHVTPTPLPISEPELKTTTKDVSAPVTTDKQILKLDQLPLQIGDFWTLSKDDESTCILSHKKVSMPDGQGNTPVSLIITADKIIFKTKSNIDITYKQSGVSIDSQTLHPIEALHNEFSIQYFKHYKTLMTEMKMGKQLVLALGFWPTWPVTQTHDAIFDLVELSGAYDVLTACQKL